MLAPAVPPRRIKILTVGDAGVGKSCLIKRHCEGRFVGEYITTIGIDYGVRKWEDSSSPSVVAAAAGSKTDMNFSGSATALNSASESEEGRR